jgi:hypothetical protein
MTAYFKNHAVMRRGLAAYSFFKAMPSISTSHPGRQTGA